MAAWGLSEHVAQKWLPVLSFLACEMKSQSVPANPIEQDTLQDGGGNSLD